MHKTVFLVGGAMSLNLGLTYENMFPPGLPLYCKYCSIIPFVKQSMLMVVIRDLVGIL